MVDEYFPERDMGLFESGDDRLLFGIVEGHEAEEAEQVLEGDKRLVAADGVAVGGVVAQLADKVYLAEDGRLQDIAETTLVHEGGKFGIIGFAQVGIVGIEPADGLLEGAPADDGAGLGRCKRQTLRLTGFPVNIRPFTMQESEVTQLLASFWCFAVKYP